MNSSPLERAIRQELKRRTVKIRVIPIEQSLDGLTTAVPIKIGESGRTLSPKIIGITRFAVAVLLITEDMIQATTPKITISQ